MDKNKILAALAVALLVGTGIGRMTSKGYTEGRLSACNDIFGVLQSMGMANQDVQCVKNSGEVYLSIQGLLFTLDGKAAPTNK